MRTGFGGLKWRPDDFWAATLTEFFDAIDGHNEAQGGKTKGRPPSDAEVEALVTRYG